MKNLRIPLVTKQLLAPLLLVPMLGFANTNHDGASCESKLGGIGFTDQAEITKQAGLLKRLNMLIPKKETRAIDPELLAKAREAVPRVGDYLQSLRNSNFERDFVIDALFRALLSKKHVLLSGGAGVGKSKILREALANITLPSQYASHVASLPISANAKRDITKPYNYSGNQNQQNLPAETRFTSFFNRAMSAQTKEAHVFGDIDNSLLLKDGTRRLRLDLGGTNHLFAFLDEFLDAPPELLRSFLTWMNEGVYHEGKDTYHSATNTIVAATNYYLSEAFAKAAKSDVKLEANMDRIASILIIPRKFADAADPAFPEGSRERIGSKVYMMRKYADGELDKITQLPFEDLMELQKLWAKVEIPSPILVLLSHLGDKVEELLTTQENESIRAYKEAIRQSKTPEPIYRKAKQYSPRFYNNGIDALRSFVIMEWLKNPNRPLVANFADIASMGPYIILDGPSNAALNKLLSAPHMPEDERLALMSLKKERQAFFEAWKAIIEDF